MAIGAIFGGIGFAIGVGASATAASAIIAGIAVTAVVGAAVGGLVAAVTGGDIGKGMLYGAVGGVALGAAAGLAGLGAAASTTTGTSVLSNSGAGFLTTAEAASAQLGVAQGAAIGSGAGAGAAGAVAGASAGSTLGSLGSSWGVGLATAAASGLEKVYEGEQTKDAMKYKAEQESLQREWQSQENDKALASAEARATGSSAQPFYLEEKQALAAQQYAATAKLSEDESARRIEEYKAKLEGDEGVMAASRERAAEGILGSSVGEVGEYVEGESINQQVADSDVTTYDDYTIEGAV